MTIAEKLTTVAENQQRVYDAGAKSEYDHFWDEFQRKGAAVPYNYAFAYSRYDDETYNPKYDIVCSSGSSTAQQTFYKATKITDTKVTTDFRLATSLLRTFDSASVLVTIRKLIVKDTQEFSNTFSECPALQNITIEGTIGKSISFSSCSKLTVESMKSIISCLKDYSGTSSANSCTVTFPSARWTALEEDSAAPDGGTWKDYVMYTLCWNT